MEYLEVNGLSFEIRRSARRKTFGITVGRAGELIVQAPESATRDDLANWTRSKMLWVHRKLALKEAMEPTVREPEYVSGENFYYLGRSHRLAIVEDQDQPLQLSNDRFYLRHNDLPTATLHFRDWYIGQGREWVGTRVEFLAPRIGSAPTRYEVRDLGFRWGSCGKNGVVYVNWRVLQLPVGLVDYVIAHELAHLQELHHGPEFWAVLDRSLPDWRLRGEGLKLKAREIHWCHASMLC